MAYVFKTNKIARKTVPQFFEVLPTLYHVSLFVIRNVEVLKSKTENKQEYDSQLKSRISRKGYFL